MQIMIITGLSGAGKTVAMQSLEDAGYYCVDNLPPALIPKFVDLVGQSSSALNRVAFACDLRGGLFFQPLADTLQSLHTNPELDVQVVFLESDESTLVRRYKESRRRHPYVEGARLLDSIQAEHRDLAQVRELSDVILDTSQWKPTRLKEELLQRFSVTNTTLPVHIVSFGFKYGIPIDADMILDVRFLPNPHYIDALRPYTGEDAPVYDYVMQQPATQEFLTKIEDLVDFLIPEFTKEGKSHLVIAIGCTGGKHRSVAVARYLQEHLQDVTDIHLIHRDSRREG